MISSSIRLLKASSAKAILTLQMVCPLSCNGCAVAVVFVAMVTVTVSL